MDQPPRVIFIEGVPFTGKSTTAELIATQLELNGRPRRWVSEGQLFRDFFPHVIAAMDGQAPLSEESLRAEWQAFAQTVEAADQTFVVDSALSYALLGVLLGHDMPLESIRPEMRHIAQLFAPLAPRVIHLTGDVSQLVPDSITERGPGWREQMIRQADANSYVRNRGWSGLEGGARFLHDSQERLREMLSADGWRVLTLDVSAPGRAAHHQAMLDFLDLTEVVVERPEIGRDLLEAYAGSYVIADPDRHDKLYAVKIEGDGLALHGPDTRYGPLIPLTTTRFHIQGAPVDLEFGLEAGQAPHLTIFSSDGQSYRYERS